jgi:hypothetical protein
MHSFYAFQSVLFQTYPDLDVDGYVGATAFYLGHCEAKKRDFLQRFEAVLNS